MNKENLVAVRADIEELLNAVLSPAAQAFVIELPLGLRDDMRPDILRKEFKICFQ